LNRPFLRNQPPPPQFRINGKIRAREVRVITPDGKQAGVLELSAAINLARVHGMDLVEIAPNAVPPVCKIVEFGKFKYELAKKERESKKHQHSTLVKEIQLSPTIDPHDQGIKTEHAIDFFCEDMKVKVTLRFRGRQMAHTEIGMGVVQKFLRDIAPWGQPDNPPKLQGRSIIVMISALPKNKRAKNPKEGTGRASVVPDEETSEAQNAKASNGKAKGTSSRVATDAADSTESFAPSPFEGLALPGESESEPEPEGSEERAAE